MQAPPRPCGAQVRAAIHHLCKRRGRKKKKKNTASLPAPLSSSASS